VAQTTTPIVSSSVEKSSDATSVDETFVVHPTLEVATTHDAICTLTSKALVVSLKMR